MSAERIRPLRPYNPAEDTAEQPDPIAKLSEQETRVSGLLKKRTPYYERYGMGDTGRLLESAHARMLSDIRDGLAAEAREFVVFEASKVAEEIEKEEKGKPKKRKERVKKSQGLNDPRPIEFSVPGTGKMLRGKEGKGLRLLFESASNSLNRDQLAKQLHPGIKLETARENVNRTIRSARKHLAGSRFDVRTRRDYEKKTTYYDWVEKSRKPKQKKR